MKNKIKKFFSTPVKATLSIISLITILAILGTGTVYAAGTMAQNSSIGEEQAKNVAFSAAGVDPTTAKEVQVEFDYEEGQFVYEVDFLADGTEYEYLINASNGTVVKKDIEVAESSDKNTNATAQITLQEAKEIALRDAKLNNDAVTFTTAKLDTEDNGLIYEIEFFAQNVEYDYEINANDGTIYSKDKELIDEKEQKSSTSKAQESTKLDTKENTSSAKPSDTKSDSNSAKPVTNKQEALANQITLDTAKVKALADANVSASSVTYTKAKLDYDDGIAVYEIEFYTSTHEYEYEINATTGAVHDKSVEALEKNTGSSSNYIGINKAKSIAVDHAGLTISSVTFSKAKLDTDDGKTLYEIEFVKDGMEYEYEVDANSGRILEYDREKVD